MKKKRTTYLLLITVLIVWGIIVYKFFDTVQIGDDYTIATESYMIFKPDTLSKPANFSIVANYRDPFLGELQRDKMPLKKVKKKIKLPEVVFPEIIYHGMIDPKQKKRASLFIITVNNKQQFLSVGQKIEGVQLLKGNSKEITILFEQRKKTIQLN